MRNSARARELSRILEKDGFHNACITGDMSTEARLENFKQFKGFQYRILVSTQLFGRGIDVEKVNVVINYDFPMCVEDYIHRVGRAGRKTADGYSEGVAVSFFTDTSAKVTRVGVVRASDV